MQTHIVGIATHRHYAEVAGALDIPIRFQNISSATRYDCSPDEVADMADTQGIDSVKDASGDAN